MGKTKEPEMFSGLTHEELNALYATLGSGADEAGRDNYAMASEIGKVREDVHQAVHDVTRAEFAERTARAQAARAEAEPELDLF